MEALANMDIRSYAKNKGVKLWQVSEELGFSHESNFSRTMRHELPPKRKAELKNVIDRLSLKLK